ncbi:RND transporter [Hydrogenophaga crassostreae]|uniref:RND transporter n=1 Tax=Hydrogenophaga crassostreae TaxID=1763535 RepID=A0A162PD97_9BURK|nr:efflux transporter outer membrane subunit [Hydrogenophaga crassostreae]AOW15315.1 RND transporter [Hydrogenophaga crassostreae]OAD43936.1 RND transporter [Hydrogenophaga crassostreae]
MAIRPTLLISRRLIPIGLAFTLVACAGLPTPSGSPEAGNVPLQWVNGSARADAPAHDLSTWWNRFNDPTLGALITQALEANPSVQGAQAALRQSRALADLQQAGLGPALGTSASAQRSRSGDNDTSNKFQLGFDASWEPDIFGGNRSAANASEADVQASKASLANVRISLAAEVALGYINVRALQTRLDIAQSNLDKQQETLQITQWRAQAGLASSLDVEQSISATEQTRAQLPALKASAAQAMNALAILTGQAPGALASLLATPAPIPASPPDLALAFPADTLRQRPDVATAEQRIAAALSRVASAEAARYPSLRLSGSLGLSALTLGTLTNSASLLQSVLAGLSAPLFDGGANAAQVRAQQAALDQARATYQSTVLSALGDVENALVALQGDGERLARLQTASDAAANAELLARQRYQSGLTDFSTVLTTQRTLLSLQDSLASAQGSLSADHVQLYKALGGGWQPDTQIR